MEWALLSLAILEMKLFLSWRRLDGIPGRAPSPSLCLGRLQTVTSKLPPLHPQTVCQVPWWEPFKWVSSDFKDICTSISQDLHLFADTSKNTFKKVCELQREIP